MKEFAEQEIIIPSGDFEGLRYRVDRQPHLHHWFNAVDSGRWNRFVKTGCVQSGKSLNGYVIPLIYHLFEEGETVVCGVPQMIMAGDKWRRDILPIIEASRYAQYLPTRGKGSRGGSVDTIQFTHGPILKFMSGGGDDKTRSGFTTRIVVVTEVEGLAVQAMTEGEPDRLLQIENRTGQYAHRKRIYLECTTSSLSGRIWQEYLSGSFSQIVCTCPHCLADIVPLIGEGNETKDLWRDSLKGWQDAKDEIEAEENSYYCCPKCDATISEEERFECNVNSKLVHGNERTRTFSYRYSCFNNSFDAGAASFIGAKEYAANNAEGDEARKEVATYYWTLPYINDENEFEAVSVSFIRGRSGNYSRYTSPPCELMVAAIDVGKHTLHYTITSETRNLTNHIVEYDTYQVLSFENQVDDAVMTALIALCKALRQRYRLDLILVDARYATEGVAGACRQVTGLIPVFGMSNTQNRKIPMPSKTVGVTRPAFYMQYDNRVKQLAMFVISDRWKGELFRRLLNQPNTPGSIDIHKPHDQYNHLEFAKHLTAEEPELRNGVYRWNLIRSANHWLDSTIYTLAGLHKMRTTTGAPSAANTRTASPINLDLTQEYRRRR